MLSQLFQTEHMFAPLDTEIYTYCTKYIQNNCKDIWTMSNNIIPVLMLFH